MSGSDEVRTDLRRVEQHASWREVYYALDVKPDQHERHADTEVVWNESR